VPKFYKKIVEKVKK